MIRHISADLYEAGECVTGASGHEAVNVYVLLNAGHPILIDCGSQLHRAVIMQALDELLAGQAPEYVLLTHSELPHAGNLAQVARQWPQVKVIVSNVMLPYIEIAPVLPLAQITALKPGTVLSLAGRTLRFVEALLKDQPGSQWIFDPQTGALFTGDGFGYYHPAAACGKFSDELADGVSVEQFRDYHRAAFRFLRWVVADRLNADLDQLFGRYSVRAVAPIHGSAIRAAVPEHVGRLKRALTQICAEHAMGGH
jgi:flavorubredoxin